MDYYEEKIKQIGQVVCYYLGLPESNLYKKSRKRKYSFPRQIVFYFACYFFKEKYSLAKIGAIYFKDHAAVLHAKKTIENLVSVDKNISKQIDEIFYKLRFLFQNNDIDFLEKEEIELKGKLSCVYQKFIDFYDSKYKEECNDEFILKKYEYIDKLLKLN